MKKKRQKEATNVEEAKKRHTEELNSKNALNRMISFSCVYGHNNENDSMNREARGERDT